MAAAHLSLTRRALLAGACTVPVLSAVEGPLAAAAGEGRPSSRRKPGSPSGRAPSGSPGDPGFRRDDGESFVCTNWDRALKGFQKAEAALTAAAHTEDEDLYDRLGDRHDRALQRLLLTPAPNVAALALKLDLALYEAAEEFVADLAAMRALKRDAHCLAALTA